MGYDIVRSIFPSIFIQCGRVDGGSRQPRLSAELPLLSVPVRPGPDEREAFLTFDLDQGRVDRSREVRVVELDREVVAAFIRGLLPCCVELDIAGEDAEVRTLFGGALDCADRCLDVEVEGLDRAVEAVAGSLSRETVIVTR
jgi:hypothetical protein